MTTFPLTVVVPTFNRKDVLALCLAALEQQSSKGFEVIVVDDGSTDGTPDYLSAFARTTQLKLLLLRQDNAGPATARNTALAQVDSAITLFIGDDILASPSLIEKHLEFHRSHSDMCDFALGRTLWDKDHQQVTPFMRWYEKIQFDYDNLIQGTPATWQHAYTSNLSGKTTLLRKHGFDPRFPFAGWEDSELAYRLWKNGQFHLTFLPEASASHVHPTTLQQAVRRMQVLGRMERLFHQLHPEVPKKAGQDASTRVCALLGRHPLILRGLTKAAENITNPGKFHSMVLRAHHQMTYRAATRYPSAIVTETRGPRRNP